jgi:hypothetical protein
VTMTTPRLAMGLPLSDDRPARSRGSAGRAGGTKRAPSRARPGSAHGSVSAKLFAAVLLESAPGPGPAAAAAGSSASDGASSPLPSLARRPCSAGIGVAAETSALTSRRGTMTLAQFEAELGGPSNCGEGRQSLFSVAQASASSRLPSAREVTAPGLARRPSLRPASAQLARRPTRVNRPPAHRGMAVPFAPLSVATGAVGGSPGAALPVALPALRTTAIGHQ